MLQPIPHTSARINSCLLSVNQATSKPPKKRVNFSHEGKLSLCTRVTVTNCVCELAIAMSEVHAKRETPRRTRQPKEVVQVIGSSCTWRDPEIEQFKVDVQRDVDPKQMIPERFFNFEQLEGYLECTFSFYSFSAMLILFLGKAELCELSESDAINSKVVSKVRNPSRLVFQYLCQILQQQPEARRVNLSQKRAQGKQSQSSESKSQGTSIVKEANFRSGRSKFTIHIGRNSKYC